MAKGTRQWVGAWSVGVGHHAIGGLGMRGERGWRTESWGCWHSGLTKEAEKVLS